MFYDFHIFVCVNRRPDGHPRGSCAERNSEALRDYMKRRVKQLGFERARVNAAGCLDRCELGPCVLVYPSGLWYKVRNEADAELLLSSYRTRPEHADSLLLADDQ